jgi:hypothetical protein
MMRVRCWCGWTSYGQRGDTVQIRYDPATGLCYSHTWASRGEWTGTSSA